MNRRNLLTSILVAPFVRLFRRGQTEEERIFAAMDDMLDLIEWCPPVCGCGWVHVLDPELGELSFEPGCVPERYFGLQVRYVDPNDCLTPVSVPTCVVVGSSLPYSMPTIITEEMS